MLILTRKPGESLYIGDNVKVVVVEVKGSQVRIGIEADKSLRIYREEIYLQILEENKNAAAGAQNTEAGLEGLSEAWKGRKDAPATDAGKARRSLSISSLTSKGVGGAGVGEEARGNRAPEIIKRKKKKSEEDEEE